MNVTHRNNPGTGCKARGAAVTETARGGREWRAGMVLAEERGGCVRPGARAWRCIPQMRVDKNKG
jgi:hypothetical protein